MIVMKFGGSSVESAPAIRRVAGIVAARLERRPVVVVSAMGRTTNRLLVIAAAAAGGDRARALDLLRELHRDHMREAGELVRAASAGELHARLDEMLLELEDLVKGLSVLGELTPRSTDAISSYGERLSSEIVTRAFENLGVPATHLDARGVIVTDHRHTQAAPLYHETYERLARIIPPLTSHGVVVMGGFIGSTLEGVTSTLGRGGSDLTASLVGAGIRADEIQIWTDVDGMLTADPRIFAGPYRVKTISFAEAAELAYFGAKVLHPSTVLPAIESGIPVLILNSRRPKVAGTRIVRETVHADNVAKAIACKRDITLLNIVSTRMLMAHGFLRRIFEVFDRYETPVDMVATSEVSVSLTIDNAARLDDITRELSAFAEVSVERDQAILCLVGENIRRTPGVASRVFRALEPVNVLMISQGASLLNLSVVVAGADLVRAVERLHDEFFSNPDPAIFEPVQTGAVAV
ncbi:MAG: lysine-sensitive aspartokinase 3 [Acidobacteria bacterium]|nr:lysine-sensitive aspartokinase 3 [Acidobacteriota bacterium]